MNSAMSIVMIWWFVSAHKWFKGPVINVEVSYIHPTLTFQPRRLTLVILASYDGQGPGRNYGRR